MSKKKGLGQVSPPNYGTICIIYATPMGWVYGSAETTKDGVVFMNSAGDAIAEPKPWVPCKEPSGTPMQICGPVEIAGLGEILAAAATKDCVLTCGADGFIAVNGVPSVVPCPVAPNAHALDDDGNLVITSPDGTSTTYVINNNTSNGPYTDLDGDGVYTADVFDADGNPTGETVDSDFNALISSPHPDSIPDTYNLVTVNEDGSITIQYMNEDGPVGDPIVIPAAGTCSDLPTFTQQQVDASGAALVCVGGVMGVLVCEEATIFEGTALVMDGVNIIADASGYNFIEVAVSFTTGAPQVVCLPKSDWLAGHQIVRDNSTVNSITVTLSGDEGTFYAIADGSNTQPAIIIDDHVAYIKGVCQC